MTKFKDLTSFSFHKIPEVKCQNGTEIICHETKSMPFKKYSECLTLVISNTEYNISCYLTVGLRNTLYSAFLLY